MPSGSGVKTDAFQNYGTNAGTAAGALSTVNPIYSKLATGTVGLTPQQQSNALTASGQSLGGGVASAVGQGDLMAARTGNVGGYTAALDDASRQAGVQQSSNALGVQNQSDQIARQNQQIGLGGLSGIYNDANGQANQSLQVANQAQPGFFSKLLMASLQPGASAYGAYANNN